MADVLDLENHEDFEMDEDGESESELVVFIIET